MAAGRDLRAAVRVGLAEDLSELGVQARSDARDDREGAAADRRNASTDRRSAAADRQRRRDERKTP
jgi:hypothetical protein